MPLHCCAVCPLLAPCSDCLLSHFSASSILHSLSVSFRWLWLMIVFDLVADGYGIGRNVSHHQAWLLTCSWASCPALSPPFPAPQADLVLQTVCSMLFCTLYVLCYALWCSCGGGACGGQYRHRCRRRTSCPSCWRCWQPWLWVSSCIACPGS